MATMPELSNVDMLAALREVLGNVPTLPPSRPLSYDEQRAEDYWESRAEDAAYERAHGHMSDREIQDRENAYERHLDRLGGSL